MECGGSPVTETTAQKVDQIAATPLPFCHVLPLTGAYVTFESRRKPRRLGRGKPVVGGRKVSVVAVSVGLL